jgi:hypothetical protein
MNKRIFLHNGYWQDAMGRSMFWYSHNWSVAPHRLCNSWTTSQKIIYVYTGYALIHLTSSTHISNITGPVKYDATSKIWREMYPTPITSIEWLILARSESVQVSSGAYILWNIRVLNRPFWPGAAPAYERNTLCLFNCSLYKQLVFELCFSLFISLYIVQATSIWPSLMRKGSVGHWLM